MLLKCINSQDISLTDCHHCFLLFFHPKNQFVVFRFIFMFISFDVWFLYFLCVQFVPLLIIFPQFVSVPLPCPPAPVLCCQFAQVSPLHRAAPVQIVPLSSSFLEHDLCCRVTSGSPCALFLSNFVSFVQLQPICYNRDCFDLLHLLLSVCIPRSDP